MVNFDLEEVKDNIVERVEDHKDRKNRNLAFLVIILLLVLVISGLIIFSFVKQNQYRKQLEQTYQEAFEAGRGQEEIIIAPEIFVEKATVMEVLNSVQELTVDKYVYSNIGVYEKDKKIGNFKVPFTTDKTIYYYKGTIGLGIKDILNSDITIDDDNKRITIILPKCEILYHEFDNDSFKTYDVKNSIFTETNLNEYNDLIKYLKESQEELLLNDKRFWEEANDSISTKMKQVFGLYSIPSEYEVLFRTEE